MNVRLVIFDADGTLRRTLVEGQPCPHAAHEWDLLEGVRACVSSLPRGLKLGVASNQDHVGYGLVGYRTAHALLVAALESAAVRPVDEGAVRLCPHRLEEPCDCRKPSPGLLLQIMDHCRVPPRATLFVGNEGSDALAAQRAGVAFLWIQELLAAQARGVHARSYACLHHRPALRLDGRDS